MKSAQLGNIIPRCRISTPGVSRFSLGVESSVGGGSRYGAKWPIRAWARYVLSYYRFSTKTVRDHSGKTCVVTGATSGIGKSAALALTSSGSHLILVSRHEPAGHRLVQRLRHRSPGSSFEFIRTDLSRQDAVREMADSMSRRHSRVDVLNPQEQIAGR